VSATAIATWPCLYYVAFAERTAADAAALALAKLHFRCEVSGRGEPLSPEAAFLDAAVCGNERPFALDATEFYLAPLPFGDSLDGAYLLRALAQVSAESGQSAFAAVVRIEHRFGGEGRGSFGQDPSGPQADPDDRFDPFGPARRAYAYRPFPPPA
jgi:hypothetical protein